MAAGWRCAAGLSPWRSRVMARTRCVSSRTNIIIHRCTSLAAVWPSQLWEACAVCMLFTQRMSTEHTPHAEPPQVTSSASPRSKHSEFSCRARADIPVRLFVFVKMCWVGLFLCVRLPLVQPHLCMCSSCEERGRSHVVVGSAVNFAVVGAKCRHQCLWRIRSMSPSHLHICS